MCSHCPQPSSNPISCFCFLISHPLLVDSLHPVPVSQEEIHYCGQACLGDGGGHGGEPSPREGYCAANTRKGGEGCLWRTGGARKNGGALGC